jgi:hypothetical protein
MIDAMSADIEVLKKQVADFESTHPQMNDRDRAGWERLKVKVQLIEIFHGQKQQLAGGDLARNRGLIRAHAAGVAKRAEMLQRTLAELARAPIS